MTTTYQTHDDAAKGMSDSARKLARLKMPADMTGKSFLDIGCNEGYFCNAAASRGSNRVVGIDFVGSSLDFARQRYPNPVIEWRHQSWDVLPEGPFDVVLWSSAMHYEPDPAKVLGNIANLLTPTGMLILELGVIPMPTQEMILVQRHSDSRWYPTELFLTTTLLRPFAFRRVADKETTEGDPVPREVYHCHRRQPLVLVIRGESYDGKSNLARNLAPAATKVIALDSFMFRIAMASFHHTPTQQYIHQNYNASDLTSLYYGIDEAGLTRNYAALLAQAVAPSDGVVVIEGLMTDQQVNALADQLRSRAIVWDATRPIPGVNPNL
jgi:SAM-dependent methyltransferase